MEKNSAEQSAQSPNKKIKFTCFESSSGEDDDDSGEEEDGGEEEVEEENGEEASKILVQKRTLIPKI